MAKGGWKYSGLQLGPHGDTLAEDNSDLNAIANIFVNSGTGWSGLSGPLKVRGTDSDFATAVLLGHSSGNRCMIGISNYYNGRLPMSVCTHKYGSNLWIIYGGSTLGNLDPTVGDNIINDGLYASSLVEHYYRQGVSSSVYSILHLALRSDGSFWLAMDYEASKSRGLNSYILAGPIITENQHSSDSGWMHNIAVIGREGNYEKLKTNFDIFDYPSKQLCTFAAAHDGMTRRRRQGDGARFFAGQNVFIDNMYLPANSTSVAWSTVHLGVQGSDLDTKGVVPNNGFKGAIDSGAMIAVDKNGLQPFQLLDGGNYIYIGEGIALGWDSSNSSVI